MCLPLNSNTIQLLANILLKNKELQKQQMKNTKKT
jgi:hypothetical protein